jgi:hypothetical protein
MILEEIEYTTDDEIEFIFTLANADKWAALAGLRRAYRTRSWDGEGMNVDPARVNSVLDFVLSRRLVAA